MWLGCLHREYLTNNDLQTLHIHTRLLMLVIQVCVLLLQFMLKEYTKILLNTTCITRVEWACRLF